jgi:hypothetical protein
LVLSQSRKNQLMVSVDRVLENIFGPKSEEIIGGLQETA